MIPQKNFFVIIIYMNNIFQFNKKSRFRFFYNNGQKTKELFQVFEDNKWVTVYLTNFIYDQQNLIRKMKYYIKHDVKLINEIVYSYNEKNKLDKEHTIFMNATNFINILIKYNYDNLERIKIEEIEESTKTEYIYNAESKLKEEIFYRFINNVWEVVTKSINFFENDKLIKCIEYIIKNNEWKEYTKITYEYDKNNNCIKEIFYDFRNNIWHAYIEISNYYNIYQNIIKELVLVIDDNKQIETNYLYNKNNNLIQVSKNNMKFLYKYDKNNNLIEYYEYL